MKKSALSPEPINKVGILVLSDVERKKEVDNVQINLEGSVRGGKFNKKSG